jgi:hypothetical protein
MSVRSHHAQAIEFLARESRLPIDEVAQLYEDAHAELEVGARIKGFLGIFALRNVRTVLRQRAQLHLRAHRRGVRSLPSQATRRQS